jgi:hypothetical protein
VCVNYVTFDVIVSLLFTQYIVKILLILYICRLFSFCLSLDASLLTNQSITSTPHTHTHTHTQLYNHCIIGRCIHGILHLHYRRRLSLPHCQNWQKNNKTANLGYCRTRTLPHHHLSLLPRCRWDHHGV